MRKIVLLFVALFAAVSLQASDRKSLYTDLAALSPAEAKSVLRRHDPAARAELWSLHLDAFVAAHPELSDAQRSVVFEARGLLAAGVLAATASNDVQAADAARNAIKQFETRARSLFTGELFAEAFVHIGKRDARGPQPRRIRVLQEECSCDFEWTYCWGLTCQSGTGCLPMPEGCGPFGHNPCWGLCE